MQAELHRELKETEVTCGCGKEFTVYSTEDRLKVELCSDCHPFYTGQQKLVDTEGRVEKFQDKYGWSSERASELAGTAPSDEESETSESTEEEETEASAESSSESEEDEVKSQEEVEETDEKNEEDAGETAEDTETEEEDKEEG